MNQSAITKQSKILYWIFATLSFIATCLPIFIYVIKGYCDAEEVDGKVGLTCTIMISAIMFIISIVLKYSIRSTIWVLLLGVYFCLNNILAMIIWIAVGTILDEIIFSPLKRKFKNKFTINKEIDRRL